MFDRKRMVNVKHMEDSKDVKLTEVPEDTILSNTLKLISNVDGHIRQIGVDLLKEYITTSLSEQIQTINNYIGNLQSLSTSEKANVVGAINEINNSVSTNNLGVQQNTENISLLNSNLINRFECGNVDITGKRGEWVFVTVNYSYPHENIPFVVASHGSAEVAQCACTTRYRTTTGFQIGVYNTTAHTTFNWIAIEP